jgi:hypothetical protein
MPATVLETSAITGKQLFDSVPLGAIIRYFDGTPRPPERFTRKLTCWERTNGMGRLVEKQPESRSGTYLHEATFTLNTGNYHSATVLVLRTFQVFGLSTKLNFDVIEVPAAGSVRVLTDKSGGTELIHLAASQAEAEAWLAEHPYSSTRFELCEAPTTTNKTFTYLQDPAHGWLLVSKSDLAAVGLAPEDFSSFSYARDDTFALEEDCDMSIFLNRMKDRRLAYQLAEQHIKHTAYVRTWETTPGRPAPRQESAPS